MYDYINIHVLTDIDYMDRHRDFTLDPDHFPLPGMRRLVESLHAAHQHWVPIIDPGIPLVVRPVACV